MGECLQRLTKQGTADANYILLLEPVANNIYTQHLKITKSRHIRIRTALQVKVPTLPWMTLQRLPQTRSFLDQRQV